MTAYLGAFACVMAAFVVASLRGWIDELVTWLNKNRRRT